MAGSAKRRHDFTVQLPECAQTAPATDSKWVLQNHTGPCVLACGTVEIAVTYANPLCCCGSISGSLPRFLVAWIPSSPQTEQVIGLILWPSSLPALGAVFVSQVTTPKLPIGRRMDTTRQDMLSLRSVALDEIGTPCVANNAIACSAAVGPGSAAASLLGVPWPHASQYGAPHL